MSGADTAFHAAVTCLGDTIDLPAKTGNANRCVLA
eukprot:CAMPEP_0182947740 /NCGR_PEP_ID=MMETSP0105_2-20130417/59087_1 /TAXON_ID=81532 ORGANISM="Acanthoeca-like sp., Strain 10tr" /NCGR_SAMPLE_ID=MMETSP0105_2 /ASSEMBLY_ACC=CAM_ASM_000205 /LENGTH=34 /DNA_ID= /DNA_START= /DNA_END= /DNA_ORIENTATION=